MAGEHAWCQFVYTHECRDPVVVTKDIFTFGRSPDCDGSFAGCRFMSANHCYIMKDHQGKAWLHDTSTNGTLVNGKRVKSQSVQLCDKDEIKLVYRKDVNSIGFVYLDLKLKDDKETVLENTQEYHDEDDDNTPKLPDSQDNQISITGENEKLQGKRTHCQVSSTSGTDSPEAKRQHVDSETDREPKVPELSKNSSLAENLLCNICQDIFHDCVSLQPCMHSYCAACYSQWMERSKECPSCRLKVSRINRNHLVNNLVDAFLKENPGRKRPPEEIEEMNKKNKITSDMLKPPTRRHGFGSPLFGSGDSDSDSMEDSLSETSESDHSLSEYNHDDDNDDDDFFNPFSGGSVPDTVAGLFGFLNQSLSSDSRRRITPAQVCRQCPSNASSATTASCSGSATTGSSTTTPSNYVCSPSRSHILCLCCMQYMPDRRAENSASNGTSIPRQTCCVCNRAFCHLYWGCREFSCNGCLNQFKDHSFQESIDKLINLNTYESAILKNYLHDKNISLDDMLKKCLEKLESKEYQTKDNQCTSSSVILCKRCALVNFQELAYQYRKEIPHDDLPGYVTARQDCYWGRNCRTQRLSHHATRFNHICEQKRFT